MEIQHICVLLEVFDMTASITFYRNILGFELHESAGEPDDIGWVWLKRDNLNLMLNTQYEMPLRPAQPDAQRMKAHADTILYLGCPDVDAAYLELIDKGVKCEPPKVAPYGMKQLYCHDPDGYGICFQWGLSQEKP